MWRRAREQLGTEQASASMEGAGPARGEWELLSGALQGAPVALRCH